MLQEVRKNSETASCGRSVLLALVIGLAFAVLVSQMRGSCSDSRNFIVTKIAPINMVWTHPSHVAQFSYRPGGASLVTRALPGTDELLQDAVSGYTPQQLAFLEKMRAGRGMQAKTQPRGSVARDVVKSSSQTTSPEITVQGGSLKTWSYTSPSVERVQVVLRTDGRPLDADVELWAGPDNNPHKMRVYLENGAYRPFSAVLETPRGPNTIAVRNIGALEFPISAKIDAVPPDEPLARFEQHPQNIQGGALKTYPFSPNVDSIEVLLTTAGRPLNARIELLQGPNNNKQVIEVYTEDGMDRPFYTVLQTPGSGNVVRIVNTATVEFPLVASVAAFTTSRKDTYHDMQPIIQ